MSPHILLFFSRFLACVRSLSLPPLTLCLSLPLRHLRWPGALPPLPPPLPFCLPCILRRHAPTRPRPLLAPTACLFYACADCELSAFCWHAPPPDMPCQAVVAGMRRPQTLVYPSYVGSPPKDYAASLALSSESPWPENERGREGNGGAVIEEERKRERGATPRLPRWRGRFLLRAASRLPAAAFIMSACQEGCSETFNGLPRGASEVRRVSQWC